MPARNLRSPPLLYVRGNIVTGWQDVIEELPTAACAELLPVETATSEQRAMLVEEGLAPGELALHNLLTEVQSHHMDELVERSGLACSEVLASLFDLELKGWYVSYQGSNS